MWFCTWYSFNTSMTGQDSFSAVYWVKIWWSNKWLFSIMWCSYRSFCIYYVSTLTSAGFRIICNLSQNCTKPLDCTGTAADKWEGKKISHFLHNFSFIDWPVQYFRSCKNQYLFLNCNTNDYRALWRFLLPLNQDRNRQIYYMVHEGDDGSCDRDEIQRVG